MNHLLLLEYHCKSSLEKIEINTLYETLIMVQKELNEKFQYIGNVNIYILRNVS